MKLGTAHISISVQSLKTNRSFYQRIGFTQLWEHSDPKPWALLTDGCVNIHLYESDFPSPALHYFSARMDDVARELSAKGACRTSEKQGWGTPPAHIVRPERIRTHADALRRCRDAATKRRVHALLGVFGELSINTDSLRHSLAYWKKLDFVSDSCEQEPLSLGNSLGWCYDHRAASNGFFHVSGVDVFFVQHWRTTQIA